MERLNTLLTAVIAVAALVMAGTYVHNSVRAGTPDTQMDPGTLRLIRVPNPSNIAAAGIRMGAPTAKLEVTEFSDLQCPFCRMSHQALRALMADFPEDVAYTFVHYPLVTHAHARAAARAAECGRRQGKFPEMIDILFSQQDSLGDKHWSQFAAQVGIPDQQAYSQCLEEPAEFPAVRDGLAVGAEVGVRGTPTVLVNGWLFETPPSPQELAKIAQLVLSGDLVLESDEDTLILDVG